MRRELHFLSPNYIHRQAIDVEQGKVRYMFRLDTKKLAHLMLLPFLPLRCIFIDLFLNLKLVSSNRGVARSKYCNLPVSFDLSTRSMSLEKWIHDEDCLEGMHDRWDRKEDILENRRSILAEEDFKRC
jgi:hypothetical protein